MECRNSYHGRLALVDRMGYCLAGSPGRIGDRFAYMKTPSLLFDVRKPWLFPAIIAGLLSVLLSACSSVQTQKKQFAEVDNAVAAENFSGAASSLERSKDKYYEKKDRVLYYLDLGMLYHYGRIYPKSNESLTSAEDGIDELYTKSISKGAASLLLNDNALDYSGEDYENVYLNVFKALNYADEGNYEDAFVEVRRADNKLSQLEDKYQKIADDFNQSKDAKKKFEVEKIHFNNSALARYVSMLMYRSEGKFDDARLDAQKINDAWKTESAVYDFPQPSLDSYIGNTTKARLDVIGFVGKSPELFARVLTIHTFKDAIAIYQSDGKKEEKLEVIPWRDMKDGYHFKFSLPYMEKKGTVVTRVAIELNGGEVASLQPIESLENVAQETYKLHEGITYLKTIIRTVVKGILNEKANEELDKHTGGGIWGSLTRAATSVAVDASENADLRLSRYFPAEALVGECLVDPGTYHLVLRFYSADGRLLHSDDKGSVSVNADSLSLYESFFLN
jgi:hypothetical protein